MTVTDTITSARIEVTFGSGRSYVIELESVDGLPITGQIQTETDMVEDGPASWEAGYVIKRPGVRTADITLKGKVR